MTPCARGCCWTPFSCASGRTCACHWDERRPGSRSNGTVTYANPTQDQAIRNVMKEHQRRRS